MDSVAGTSVGLSRHHIVRVSPRTGRPQKWKILGRWVYVAKCRRGEAMGGIVLPDKSRDDSVFGLILAFGEECGKWHAGSKEQRKKRDWQPSVNWDGVDVLDRVMCPDDHEWGIRRSPFGKNEFLVDECVVLANFGRADCDG